MLFNAIVIILLIIQLERIRKLMSAFLDKLQAEIAKITTDHTDPAVIANQVNAAVAAAVTPITDRIGDLETGLEKLAEHLANDDVEAAQTVVTGLQATDGAEGVAGTSASTSNPGEATS